MAALNNYKIDFQYAASSLRQTYRFSREEHNGGVTVSDRFGPGEIRSFHPENGMGIYLVDHRAADLPVKGEVLHPPDMVQFLFLIHSRNIPGRLNEREKNIYFQTGNSFVLSPGIQSSAVVPPGEGFRAAILLFHRFEFEPFLRETNCKIDPEFLQMLENGGSNFYCHQFQSTPKIDLVLKQINNSPYYGVMEELYMQAKGLELMTLRLEQLTKNRPEVYRTRWSRSDLDRLHAAREILEKDLANPPSLLQLSKMVQLNDFKLKKGFHDIFGTTVFGYLRNKRLEKGYRLLQNGDMSVIEVALEVGYTNPGYFAGQFKKYFGCKPGSLLGKS